MGSDLGTTNLWLGIMAGVALIELLALLVGGIFAYKAWRRVDAMLERLEAQQIAPLATRAHGLMDDLHVRLEQVDRTVESLKVGVRGRAWPLVGLARAVSASVGALRARPAASSSNRPPTPGGHVVNPLQE